jgi:hypothetical protein
MTPLRYPGNELDLFTHATHWKNYCKKHVHKYIHGNVLEVGAGIGSMTRFLFSEFVSSWTALEPDPLLAERFLSNLTEHERFSHIMLIEGTIQDIPQYKQYDTVLYIDVLEHIEHDTDEILRASELLTIAGRLIILAPAHNSFMSSFDKTIGHYRRYSKSSLSNIIPPSLQLIFLGYLDTFGSIATAANRYALGQNYPSKTQILLWDNLFVPLSRIVDPILHYRFGKSILGIWEKMSEQAE